MAQGSRLKPLLQTFWWGFHLEPSVFDLPHAHLGNGCRNESRPTVRRGFRLKPPPSIPSAEAAPTQTLTSHPWAVSPRSPSGCARTSDADVRNKHGSSQSLAGLHPGDHLRIHGFDPWSPCAHTHSCIRVCIRGQPLLVPLVRTARPFIIMPCDFDSRGV